MNENDSDKKMSGTESAASTPLSPLSRIGPVAVECAEQVEQYFGADAKVLSVVVVAEVLAQGPNGQWVNSIEYASSENRRWIQLALLEQAVARATEHDEKRVEEVEDALDTEEE